MRLRCLAACALVLAGCGRFGFGGDDDPRDAAIDADIDAYEPLSVTRTSVATFATSDTTFADIPGAVLQLPAAPGTRWLLLTSAMLESTVFIEVTAEARYVVDGVERGMGGTQNSLAMRPGSWQHFDIIDGTTSHVVTYQLRDASGGTATIHALSAIAIPLPANSVAFASSDSPQDVTAMLAAPQQVPLSLGALDGDYIFFTLVNATDYPALSDVWVSWVGPSGEPWLTETHLPREPWQSIFSIQRATVSSANAVVTLVTWAGSNVPSQVRYARALAVRADAFASFDYARDDTGMLTTSSIPTTAVSIATAASSASSYVLVGSVRMLEDCSGIPDADRTFYVSADALQIAFAHATDNCAYASTYGAVVPLASRPGNVKVAYSSGNALPVYYDGAQVLLLGLR